MEILNPSAQFLRVYDKIFSEFILFDPDVKKNASLLYILLFRKAYKRGGSCRIPQVILAKYMGCCVRSIQNYLRLLTGLQYICVEHRDDGCNVYRLILSERAKRFIAQAEALGLDDGFDVQQGADFLPEDHAQNLRVGGENFAPSIKSNKSNKNSTLSPLSTQAARSCEAASPRKPFREFSGSPHPEKQGRGESFHPAGKQEHTAAVAADGDFERLWSVWPVKKDKVVSRRIFLSKARTRRIPALSVLLGIVERFKAVDRHWRNNCAPLLSTWLRGDRWQDEPLEAAPGSSFGVQTLPPAEIRPEHAEQIRRCVARLDTQQRDPQLDAARPLFEAFLSHFPDGQRKRGPAWGLWSLLFKQGNAPSASNLSEISTGEILTFLNHWKRSNYATA